MKTNKDAKQAPLDLVFKAEMAVVEGVLAMACDWAGQWILERSHRPDDLARLRLVLEELLVNICLHGPAGGQVELRLEAKEARPPYTRPALGLSLKDAGAAFNPLQYEGETKKNLRGAVPGGHGLTLVRLMTTGGSYKRLDGLNVLKLYLPLGGGASFSGEGRNAPPGSGPAGRPGLSRRLARAARFIRNSLPLRQTLFFSLASLLLLWSGIGLYYLEVAAQKKTGAIQLIEDSLRIQEIDSSAYMSRLGGAVDELAASLAASAETPGWPERPILMRDWLDARQAMSVITDPAVAGYLMGRCGRTGAWLFNSDSQGFHFIRLETDFRQFLSQAGASAEWRGPLAAEDSIESGGQRLLFCGKPVGESDVWVGVILTMPWLEATLKTLDGFKDSGPFFVDGQGRYAIYPPGRDSFGGPQALTEEPAYAGDSNFRKLVDSELKGEADSETALAFTAEDSPWPAPWAGGSYLAFVPLKIPGWRLGLLAPENELSDHPSPPPPGFIIAALLGPLIIGAVTWLAASSTLKPLEALAAALEELERGDLDRPFPKPARLDEIGAMAAAFDQARLALAASFKNMAESTAAEERIMAELAIARSVQESMLPHKLPESGLFSVEALLDIANEVCGDFYDCFTLKGETHFIIGDVCGKGIPAAMLMGRALSLARLAFMEGLGPAEALAKVNRALMRDDSRGMFVTMLAATLRPNLELVWASAGHPSPILFHPGRDGGAAEVQDRPKDLALGILELAKPYKEMRLSLASGQRLLFHTDGADEAMSPDGVMYGEARLASSLASAARRADRRPEIRVLAEIKKDILTHAGGHTLGDDLTLVLLTLL